MSNEARQMFHLHLKGLYLLFGKCSGSVGRVLDLGLKGLEFKTHQRHCVVSLSKTKRHFILCLVLVQSRKTGKRPNMTDFFLLHKASTQTKFCYSLVGWITKWSWHYILNCPRTL